MHFWSEREKRHCLSRRQILSRTTVFLQNNVFWREKSFLIRKTTLRPGKCRRAQSRHKHKNRQGRQGATMSTQSSKANWQKKWIWQEKLKTRNQKWFQASAACYSGFFTCEVVFAIFGWQPHHFFSLTPKVMWLNCWCFLNTCQRASLINSLNINSYLAC